LALDSYWQDGLLAESHLTRRLFGRMVRRIEALPVPAGSTGGWQIKFLAKKRRGDGKGSPGQGCWVVSGLPGQARMALQAPAVCVILICFNAALERLVCV
jgi:hypothetical protein